MPGSQLWLAGFHNKPSFLCGATGWSPRPAGGLGLCPEPMKWKGSGGGQHSSPIFQEGVACGTGGRAPGRIYS